jgi:hypothetical protein
MASASVSPSASASATRPEAPLYVDESDLEAIRPDILNYGVSDWTDVIFRAESRIWRILEARWYRERASDFNVDPNETVFDPELLKDPDQVKDLICFKALEFAYLYLMKDRGEADAFERQSLMFQKLFKDELSNLLTAGLDYEWGTGYSQDERMVPRKRRLTRG